MSSESPAAILYSSDGYELAVISGNATPTNTRGFMTEGSDGTNSRFILVDSSGRQVQVGAGTAGTPTGGVLTVQGVTGMTALTVNNATAANLLANIGGLGAAGSAPSGNPVYIGGSVTTAAPAYSNNTMNALSLTTVGALRVDGYAGTFPVIANVSTTSPTYINGQVSSLSLDTAGNLRVTGSSGTFNNSSVSTTATAPPGSATYIGASVTTAAPGYTTGQMDPLSLTTSGQLRIDGVYPGQTATTATTDLAFVGGAVSTAAPGYTTGQMSALSLTTTGLLRVDGSGVTQPVTGTGTAGTPATGVVTIQGISGGTAIPISGTVTAVVDKSTTGTITSVAAAAVSTTLLASNANRISATFYNDSSNTLYIALTASAASTSAFTIRLLPNSYFDLPVDYTGQINGIWNGTNGACRVTELT